MTVLIGRVKNRNSPIELKQQISQLFEQLKPDINKPKRIIIKPNLCYYWDSSTGLTTSPVLVGALIDLLQEKYSNTEIFIGEADASAMKTSHAFKMLGYEKLAQEKQIKLINLSDKPIKDYETTVKGKKIKLSFNEDLINADLIINVPKLKYHRLPKVTCAMKNLFGAIARPRKAIYHKKIHDVIVATNKIIKSKIVLVDGLIGFANNPILLNTLLMSDSDFEADCITSRILHFDPKSIKYLKTAETEGLGDINETMKYWTNEMEEVSEKIPKINHGLKSLIWDTELLGINIYTKIVGDITPPLLLKG